VFIPLHAIMTDQPLDENYFLTLYKGNLIPLHACLAGLTWYIHDHILTLEVEIRYVWPQKTSVGKIMFLWIRYYTLALLLFDVVQIHLFTVPGVINDEVCIAMDSVIRVVGAISLWSIEILMQLRVYALYSCSRRVALFNAICFTLSVAGFLVILTINAVRRPAVISQAIRLPLPGCPTIHTGIEWAQWVPAAAFEFILFAFVVWKSLTRVMYISKHEMQKLGWGMSLYSILIKDNMFYFIAVTFLLLFNNLMVLGVTHIPWFSYAPFHAAIGIISTRLLLHLRTVDVNNRSQSLDVLSDNTTLTASIFFHDESSRVRSIFWPGDENTPLPLSPTSVTISEFSSPSSTRSIAV